MAGYATRPKQLAWVGGCLGAPSRPEEPGLAAVGGAETAGQRSNNIYFPAAFRGGAVGATWPACGCI